MKSSLYIFHSGHLERRQNTLRFKNKRQNRFIPVTTIRDIHLFGEVEVNTSALNFLGEHGIAMHSYNYFNSYTGSYLPRKRSSNGQLSKLKQVEYYLDEKKRLALAKALMDAAIANLEKVLGYYNRRDVDLDWNMQKLAEQKLKIKNSKNIPTLMAIEGQARSYYYKAWDSILQNDDFLFDKRTRQPPKNRLNSLISFGNMLLYSTCLTEIYSTSLDPGIGFLHATNNRSFSLNLDIAELFKPIIVDRVIFSLIRNKRIHASQFRKHKLGPRLDDKARTSFLDSYNQRLKDTVKLNRGDRPVSYRTLIRREGYKLEAFFLEKKKYQAFVAKW